MTVGKRVSRVSAERVQESVKSKQIEAILKADILYDEIVSVVPAGDHQTFDITVEGTHTFIANGVVVHNSGSLEQDPDLIFYVNWPGIQDGVMSDMDLYVLKNRNGPIKQAKVSCNFDPAYYVFEDNSKPEHEASPE